MQGKYAKLEVAEKKGTVGGLCRFWESKRLAREKREQFLRGKALQGMAQESAAPAKMCQSGSAPNWEIVGRGHHKMMARQRASTFWLAGDSRSANGRGIPRRQSVWHGLTGLCG